MLKILDTHSIGRRCDSGVGHREVDDGLYDMAWDEFLTRRLDIEDIACKYFCKIPCNCLLYVELTKPFACVSSEGELCRNQLRSTDTVVLVLLSFFRKRYWIILRIPINCCQS